MTSLRRNRDALMAAKRALLEENDESASPALSLPDPSLRRVQSAEATAEAPKANPKAFSEFEHVQTTKLKQSIMACSWREEASEPYALGTLEKEVKDHWQLIGMAYDMFVGDNVNDEGPCPPGQIVMLVRTLPQLATAMGHYENGPVDMQDIAVKATRIVQRLVRSPEGCRELLAHPVCSTMVLPTLITLADIEARVPSELGVQQLSDVALHILQLLSPFAHTLTCTLGRTTPGPDGASADELKRRLLVTLASSLTGGRLLRTRCCLEILYNFTRDAEDFPCEAFWEVLFKLPRTIVRMLLVGLVKRLSVEKSGREVGSRANMVFITVVAHPLSLYTLQEAECREERVLAFNQLLYSISQLYTPGVKLHDDADINIELTSTLRETNVSLLATWMFRSRTRTQTDLPFDCVMSAVLAKMSSFYHTRDDPDRALSLRLAMGITESLLYVPEFVQWVVARPDAIRDLVTVIDMAATVEDEVCLLAALTTLRAVLSVGALAQTLLRHKVKLAQLFMRLGELLGDPRHAVYCEAASVLSEAVLRGPDWRTNYNAAFSRQMSKPSARSMLEGLLEVVTAGRPDQQTEAELVTMIVVEMLPTHAEAQPWSVKVAALALSPWLLIDDMASCYIHLLAEMLCWPGDARNVVLDVLSNVADKSFAVEMTLPRLADCLEEQEMSIDKVLTALGVALHSSHPDVIARAQLLTEAVLEHRAAAVAKNALMPTLVSLITDMLDAAVYKTPAGRCSLLRVLHAFALSDSAAASRLAACVLQAKPAQREELLQVLCDALHGYVQYHAKSRAAPPFVEHAAELLFLLIEHLKDDLWDSRKGFLATLQVLMQMASLPEHPRHTAGAMALVATVWSSRAERLELRLVGALFLVLLAMVHHNDGDIRAAAAAALTAQLADEAWRTRMYLWMSHMPHLHSATLFKCLFLIHCDALPEPEAVAAVAQVMQLFTTKSGMNVVLASSRKAQDLLLGGMAVNLASGNPNLMLTSLEFSRRYLLCAETADLSAAGCRVLLHAHGHLDTLGDLASRPEADDATAQMLMVQGQLVVHFVTRFSPLRINDPLLLKAAATALGWVLSSCTGNTYKAAVEALLSTFSFSDELAVRQPLSPPQKQLLLGAPPSPSQEPSANESPSLALRGSPGSAGGGKEPEAAAAPVSGFLSEEELPSLLDLEDLHMQSFFLAELRRLCKSSSPVYSNVAMIVLMTFATHTRFLGLEACQLSALLHLLRDAALQGDDARRTLVVELLTSLTRSPHLQKVDDECRSLLLSCLAITLGQEGGAMAEYAASTAEHIAKRAQDVPSELLAEMLGMLSPTESQHMQIKACMALARVAQFIDLTQVEPDDVQVLLARLLELSKADTAHAHTSTILGALAGMTHAMGQVPALFDQGSLIHVEDVVLTEIVVLLFAEVLLSEHQDVETVPVCLQALGGMSLFEPWQPYLKRSAESITKENPDLVTTLCHHMQADDTVVVKGAHQLVVFIIETVGMSIMVAAQFLEDSTMLMLAEKTASTGSHTQGAIYALRQVSIWMSSSTVDDLELVGAKRSEALVEAILQLMMSTKQEVVEPARGLICALLAFPRPAKLILKVLSGSVSEQHPMLLPTVLRQYLKIVKVEAFLALSSTLLAKLGLVLLNSMRSGSALSADGATGIMFALMRTSAGANYCVELVLAAEQPVASETGMTVIHQYLMEFNTIDMIREQDTFKRLVNMLAAAALDPQEAVVALARKCTDVLRRQGAGGQWTSQCVCYMLGQRDIVRSGIACGLLEGWLTSEGSARKLAKLTPDVLDDFVQSVPRWLRAVESDAEVAYISRTADCLVMSRDVIMCNVIWLQDTNTYMMAVALKMLGLWISKYGLKELLDLDTRLLQYALEAVGRMHTDVSDVNHLLLVSFLKSVQTTPQGAAFLEKLDDVTTAKLVQTLAALLGNEDEDVSVVTIKLFEPCWTKWVLQLVNWSHSTREEAPAAGWMSWFGAAKDETAGKVVTAAQASSTLRTLLQAALQTLGTRTGEARDLGLLLLYQAIKADQTHLIVLDVESEVVKKGLRTLADIVAGPDSDAGAVLNAVSILKLLTGLPNGRYNLANRLTEGYGTKLLSGLERLVARKTEEDVGIFAAKVLRNLTSSGDASWQIWMGGGSTATQSVLHGRPSPSLQTEDDGLPRLFRGSAPR